MKTLYHLKTATCLKAILVATTLIALPVSAGAQQLDLSVLDNQSEERSTIRRLTATADQLRMEGEQAEIRLAVYAPRDEVLLYRKLQVDYLTAVSTAPEHSSMSIMVNGQPVGDIELNAGAQSSMRSFDLPPGLMVEGFNEIRFIAKHKHRVDCTIPATYELWTVLNPANTGIVFDPGPENSPKVSASLELLRAVPNDESGATNMRLLQLGTASAGNLDRALAVAQTVAAFGKYHNPDVEITNEPGAGAGLDIIVGTRAELSHAGFAIGEAQSEIPGFAIVHRPDTGRVSLFLTAENRPALDKSIEALKLALQSKPMVGSRLGIAAFENKFGYEIEPGEAVSLARIGVSSKRFDGRLLRQDFSIRLPDDYFVGDYGKAKLSLNIDALANLSNANRLQVFANGAALASAELTRDGISSRNPLDIPLGGFSPGFNDLRIEVSALTEDDAVCDVATGLNGDRLSLDAETSTIEFDALARMRVTPSLSPSDLLPKNPAESRPTTIHVLSDDPKSLEAAAQLAVATAAITQQVRPLAITTASASVGNQPGLIVAPVNRLSGVAREAYLDTLDPERTQGQRSQVARFLGLKSVDETDTSVMASIQRYAGSVWRSIGFKLNSELPSDRSFALQGNSILIAQRTKTLSSKESWVAFMGAPVKQDTWTVVTGLTSDDIKASTETMLREGRLAWLSGDTSLYNATTNRFASERLSDPNYFASLANPSDFRNSRLVVAGLVSHNMLDFVVFMLAFCLVLGFSYFVSLKRSGR